VKVAEEGLLSSKYLNSTSRQARQPHSAMSRNTKSRCQQGPKQFRQRWKVLRSKYPNCILHPIKSRPATPDHISPRNHRVPL
jgi:hypothetical protein